MRKFKSINTPYFLLLVLCFWFLSLLLLLNLLNVVGGHRKPCTGSLESRSDFAPPHPLMGQTGVIKLQALCCLAFSFFIIAFKAFACIRM